jgi:Protein of unknown function (DUF2817)
LKLETYFSPDYLTARDRFRHAARTAGARLDALELEARGPHGEALSMDIASLGAENATRLVLHTTGMHGVEAYAGSAVQLAALASLGEPPAGCALVLVHVLNPYGMAWSRRVNEHNVDLNRNFGSHGQTGSEVPGLYDRIDGIINPQSPPAFDWFPLAAAMLVFRHGVRALNQAVAEGQYTHPRGLFYGGMELEPGPQRYLEWLQRSCGKAEYVFALDVHTGLGPWSESTLILEPGAAVTPAATLARALKAALVDPAQGPGAYVIRGGMGGRLPRALPGARVDFVIQELGTYRPFKVLVALRQENRWHHYGQATLDHPAKRALLEALSPASHTWRCRVVEHGTRLLRAACEWTFYESVSGKE